MEGTWKIDYFYVTETARTETQTHSIKFLSCGDFVQTNNIGTPQYTGTWRKLYFSDGYEFTFPKNVTFKIQWAEPQQAYIGNTEFYAVILTRDRNQPKLTRSGKQY